MGPCKTCKRYDCFSYNCCADTTVRRPVVGDTIRLKGAGKGSCDLRVVTLLNAGVLAYFLYSDKTQYFSTVYVPFDQIETPEPPKAVPGRMYRMFRNGNYHYGMGNELGRVYFWDLGAGSMAFDPATMSEV